MLVAAKTTLIGLACFAAALLLCFGLFYEDAPTRPYHPITRYSDSQQAYAKLKAKYDTVLASIPKPTFKHSTQFTEIGPPIRTLSRPKGGARQDARRKKRILLWTQLFGVTDWHLASSISKGDNIICEVTTNKNDLLLSDAVLMHPVDLWYLPRERLPNQRWVYYTLEPPHLAWSNFAEYNGIFNWTILYRWDADIPYPYFESVPLEKPITASEYNAKFREILANKKRLVAIAHSNCSPQSERIEVVRQLKKYVPVDSYGRCGELSCINSKENKDCDKLFSTYKFYLSFENSRCRNYVTEKALYPLTTWNAVPIVLGSSETDYARVMPPGSYINIDGFRTVKELAEFIALLDENPVLYEKYHAWRRTHTTKVERGFQGLCESLYNDSLPLKTYKDFKGWYEQDTCDPRYSLGYVFTHTRLLYLIGLGIVIIAIATLNLFIYFKKRCCCLRHYAM